MSLNSFSLRLLLLLLQFAFNSSSTQQIPTGKHTENQKDADQTIYPWLKPWTGVIDIMMQNAKAFEFTNKSTIAMPSILTLLESFGHSQSRREQIEVGRDRTVNVFGMPVGRKDGISLAPLRGLSVGNEDMFGPIAVNDKYNINWGIFNDLNNKFAQLSQ